MRIVLSGGGTGGHITPILALAHALKALDKDLELIYIGEGSSLEQALMTDSALSSRRILAGKFRRYHGESLLSHLLDVKTIILNLIDTLKVGVGIMQSLWLLSILKPKVVFSKGGYVALPVGLAAALLRIPIVTHDSDTVPGLTNRVLRRFAKVRTSGFPVRDTIFVGSPIRESVLKSSPAVIKTKKPVLFVVGGSSGAKIINDLIFENIELLTKDYYIIHVTGERDFARAPAATANYQPIDLVKDEMGALLKRADLVISRAGANSIAEYAALGKACILIPGAHLTGGQQLKNAQLLSAKSAAYILQESELNTKRLQQAIAETLKRRIAYEKAISEFSTPNAAQKLAKIIVQYL